MAEKGKKPLLPSDYVWEQNIDSLIIFIKLKDIEYPLIKIEKNKVYLKCVAEKDRKLYEMDINLYEEINIGNSIYNIQSDGIRFFLKKQILCLWPYLTQDHKDKINASGGHIMEYFLKKSQKNYVQDVVGVVDTDEQTPKEQVSENFLETPMNPILTLASYSRCLVHVDNPAIYKIVAKDTSITLKDIEVFAKTPSKNKINANVFASNSPNTYGIKYIPKEVGIHILNVFVQGELTLVLLTAAYNINLIKIQEPEECLSEFPVKFTVDCSKAGEGELEVLVEFDFLRLPQHCNIEKLDSGKYQATFIPNLPGDYFVTVKYNNKPIKTKFNSTFLCHVLKHVFFTAKFPKETIFSTGNYYSFSVVAVEAPLISSKDIKVRIEGPTGEFFARAAAHFFLPNFFEVSFLLKEPGTYTIHTKVVGDPTGEYRQEIKAYNDFGYSMENATLYIPNRHSYSNKLLHLAKIPVKQVATFFIKYTKVNENGNRITLEVTIRDPENKQIPVLVTAYGPVSVVEFTPRILGYHIITVNYNGQVVTGTPFKAKVISNKKGKGTK